MNPLIIAIIALGVLFFAVVVLLIIFGVDWRAVFVKKWANDYTVGLAHVQLNGEMVYRNSYLIYESPRACTYTRQLEDGQYTDDIVPHEIGYSYDEYTGRRLYRAFPGGSVCVSDDAEKPAADFPAALIAVDTMGKISDKINKSVTMDAPGFPWKAVLIILAVVIIGVAALFGTGIVKLPMPQQQQPGATEPAQPNTGPAATTPARVPGSSGPVLP